MLETFLNTLQGPLLSLWGPFAILVLCGLGVPVPEDVVLLVAGALAAVEGRSWQEVSVLMYVAVIGGDSLMFLMGQRLGGRLLGSASGQRLFPAAKRARVELFYAKHGAKGLFIARFLPGLRSLIFFSAGSLRVPYLTFLWWDGLAALISVPVFVWLGHWLWEKFGHDAAHFSEAMAHAHQWSLWVVLGALGVAAGVMLFRYWRRRRAARLN